MFLGRPGFQNMLRDAAAGAFDVVVMFDLDRFGRHGQKSMEALNALADAGVEVYDYSTGQQVDLDSFEGETSAWLKTRMAQQFRDQIRKHTRAAMRPEGTLEGEYSRLLEQAYRAGSHALRGTSPTGHALMYGEDSITIELGGQLRQEIRSSFST